MIKQTNQVMKKTYTQRRSLLAKCFQGKRHLGFTLIELLATLTIMAIMAAILFPFISNYIEKARKNSTVRSLRLLQDAMDRYRAVNELWTPLAWGTNSSGAYSPNNGGTGTGWRGLQSANWNDVVFTDILGQGGDTRGSSTNQTLRIPPDGITNDNAKIVLSGDLTQSDTWAWDVIAFRRRVVAATPGGDGVTRETDWVRGNHWATFPGSGTVINDMFDGTLHGDY